jgi:ABC-type Fe3+-siderophore transport system permease subunit
LKKSKSQLLILSGIAITALFVAFINGVFYTGETARICMFIYPYLLFLVAYYFKEKNFSRFEQNTMLYLVFAQTVIMQLLGNFFW